MARIDGTKGDSSEEKGRPDPLQAVRKSSQNTGSQRTGKAAMTIPDDYMTLINRNYVYECATEAYCNTLGKPKHDVIRNPVMNVWGDEIFYEIIKNCLDNCFAGEKVDYEGWMEFPGHGRRYYHVSHHPYTNDQGEVTHAAVALRDISELKLEEEMLRRSESDLKAVLKNVHFGVYSFDTHGRFTFVNDVVVARTGYTREWFMGRSLFDFVLPEDRDEVQKYFDASIQGLPVPPYEFAYYRASGSISWVQVNATPLWEKGSTVGVLCVLLDITKRKKSEQALRESEKKYRGLFEDSRDAIFMTDKKGKLTEANTSFLNLFGYSKETAIGLDVIDMYVNHDDREVCVRAMNENGFVKDYELKLKKEDGTLMDALLTGTARRDGSGAMVSYQGIVRDESGRKHAEEAFQDSEQKLRSIIEGSPIPQFVIDKNHKVTHWNKALEAVSGIKAEDVEGTKQHWRAFYRMERPCIADLIVAEAEAEMSNWYKGEDIKSDVVDGAYRAVDFFQELGNGGKWLYFTAAAIRDGKGKVMGAVETLQDITEHRFAEDAIRKAEERCRSILEAVAPSNNEKLGPLEYTGVAL